jgi:glycosyltransferase involved in cell wall biosynthesis
MPDSGFQYRRRAESMLVNSERMRAMIVGYMRVKHAALLKPQSLIRFEETEAPRFVHHATGFSGVDLFVDPRRPKPLDGGHDAAERLFARSCKSPQAVYFPAKMLFSAPGALEQLAQAKIDRAVLWLAEILLRERHFVIVCWRFDDAGRLSVEPCATAPTLDEVRAARLIVGQTEIVKESAADPDPAWIRSISSPSPRPLLGVIRCVLPKSLALAGEAADDGAVVNAMLGAIASLGARLRGFTALKPEWRPDARRPKSRTSEVYAFNAACGVVLPHVAPPNRKQIGFILPLLEFGGVEKVVINYARVFRDRGCDVHLFLTGLNGIGSARQAAGLFSSINFLATPAADEGDWEHLYYGAGASKYARSGCTDDALGLLSTMDVVVNTHSPAAHGVMASLRKQGTRTYVGLHLVELSRQGHPMGNPNLALAYEHAYDGFVVISRQLESWCRARAIPASKILFTPNAASYPCDAARLERALARRAARDAGAPLRVLYLGRLDAQKGLDRLPEIMIGAPAPAFEWRVAGRAILADAETEAAMARIDATIEPPALSDDELDALYAWADVFVLPSRFEGVPLTILEAQRFGCIPIATDVGAVSEIIEHGVDGFLIDARQSEMAIVADFVATLGRLAASPETVAAVARVGAERQKDRGWLANMGHWLDDVLPDGNGSPHA